MTGADGKSILISSTDDLDFPFLGLLVRMHLLGMKPISALMGEHSNPRLNNVNIPDANQMNKFNVGKVNAETRNSRFKRKRYNNEETVPIDTLFVGAEAQARYHIIIEHVNPEPVDGETPDAQKFAEKNYKERLEAIMDVLSEGTIPYKRIIEMKKYKRRIDPNYKVEVVLELKNDMQILLQQTTLAGCSVKVSENIWKNTVQGIFIDHDEELKGMTNQEILAVATDKGLRDVFRFGQSKVIKVSFSGQEKPGWVHFWDHLRFKVLPYYQPPSRCYKCQRYGHKNTSCRNKFACYKCAVTYDQKEDHDPKTCTGAKKCVNCEGPHDSGNKECAKQKLEVKWVKISEDFDIPIRQAKEKYPSGEVPTYAEAVGPGPPLVPQEKIQEETQKLQKQHEETLAKLRKDAETDMNNWRTEQENKVQDLLTRITTQEETSANLNTKLDIQNKLIETLKEDLKKKDTEIEALKQKNEALIVENERLTVNAPRTMSTEIQELKKKVKEQKQQLIDKDEIIRKQFKTDDTAKKKNQFGRNK